MMRRFGLVVLLGMCGCVTSLGALAQEAAQGVAAPVPAGIQAAKSVFLSNAGADSGLFPHPFSGGADRAYNQFYTAMRSWGRYQIVNSPDAADLVLELRLFAPSGPTNANKQLGASDPLPMLRLAVLDAKTHFVLWAVTESVDPAVVQKTHDQNFDHALNALVSDLKAVVSRADAQGH